jgi:septal ring factor EnvC (AmiA/AmiB activator)
VVALQSQLSKADGDWRHESDAMQRQLQEQALQMDTMRQQLQDQTSRADEATAKWREAEADVRQCRHAMQLDADRLQVMRCEKVILMCVLLACERR